MAVNLCIKSGLARKRLSSVKLVTCYMVVIISCMPVITNGNMSTMAALVHHHGRHNNHHREPVVHASQTLQLSNEQTYLNKRQSPYKTSDKRKHQKFSTALVDDETETESVWDDIPVTPPWSHRKLVPATTAHHKSELDSKLRVIRPLRSSVSESPRINDYQSDVDFKDYESEDPRPHIGLNEHQSQLEKSLLDKEHTSTRPESSHHLPHHSPHHSDHRPELKCVLIDQQTKIFTHSAHSLLTKTDSQGEPRRGSTDDTLSDSPKSSNHHRKAPQMQRKHENNLPYTNFQSFSQCPTCYAHYLNHEKTFVENSDTKNKIDSESIRLEAIKQQILNKLGLKHRPIIKKKLPREIVLQSLYRAEEDNIDFFNDENSKYLKKITAERNNENNDKVDEISETSSGEETNGGSYSTNEVQDDFYARTSEIIVFGDAGAKLNNQQLVEFSLAKYSDTGDQELKVKAATLWVKVSFHPLLTHAKKRLVTHRNVTLWVFRLVQDHINNRISSQEFDKYMAMVTSLTVNLASLGWQKFDLTSTVRDWYQKVLKPQTTTESSGFKDRDDMLEPGSNLTHFRKSSSSQRDISRLNYESVEFGNYQNRGKSEKVESDGDTNKEYDDDAENEEQVSVSKKLRLLIDCSGCKDLVQIHLFNAKSELGEKKSNKKKLKKNRDYEFYTYDGYFNVRSSSEFQDDVARSRNKTRKKIELEDVGNGTNHKSGDNVEHRHSNHERNFRHNDSSASSINLQNSDSSSSLDPSEVYEHNSDSDNDDPNRPFLVIHTDPNIMKRVRRRALDCSGALKGQCCKQRFYVNFTDLGWSDWILAPQGYYANYCMGSCNSVHRTPDTFLNYYTHVIHEYQKYGDLKGLQPCCAPVKFSSTSLIYFGPDSNIIKRDLPKMTVDECGCP